MAKNNPVSSPDPVGKPVETTPETPVTPVIIPSPIPNPADEFPIPVDVFCRIKRHNPLQTLVFTKAMNVESRFKKLYIKGWEQKFEEFYGRKV
jgi:hypothetical protein